MSMPRYVPSVRGWVSLLLPLVGGFLFLALLPDRFIESGVGEWIGGRVPLIAWVSGGLLILVCVAACVEAFRRGSWADRVVAGIAALLTFWLIGQYLELFLQPVRRPPNHSMQRMGASGLAHLQPAGPWPLAPTAAAGHWEAYKHVL
jgi:hypothetical protein